MKKKLLVCLFSSISYTLHAACPTTTYIPIHSQSFNTARTIAGAMYHTFLPNTRQWYATLSCTPAYTKSFKPERVTQCLFGPTCNTLLTISGSAVADRNQSDWLADYFGLPTDFKSEISLCPRVRNKLIDNYLFLGLDGIRPGLFASINVPIVKTMWDLHYCEKIIEPGTTAYAPGYYSPTSTSRSDLLTSFKDFISGAATPQLADTEFHPLLYARMSPCERSYTSFSDMQLLLGYLVYVSPSGHLELHARGSVPLGNRPCADYLFEPIIGNGTHRELGGGISMHWTSEKNDQDAAARFDIHCDAAHLFDTRQRRSFDLKGRPNSRYMLAQKMGTPILDGLSGPVGSDPITAQYKQLYTPVANLTTCDIMVSKAAQIDFTCMFSYLTDSDSWSFGYGLWSCSPDSICICATHLEPERWALKGDSFMYGFRQNTAAPVALSATQESATIHTGTNNTSATNAGIDNPTPAYVDNSIALLNAPDAGAAHTKISVQPLFLSDADIDINSARSHGFAHRIFSQMGHTWQSESVNGTLSFGGEIEFGANLYKKHGTENPTVNTAFSQWGVWIKAILTFI